MRKKQNIKLTLPLMGIAAMFLALFAMPSTVSAQEQREVYVSTEENLGDISGNGSQESPYNRFEDAVTNVANDGTIYILPAQSAVINEQSGNLPFVIDKRITIEPAPGSEKATLTSRAAGIVLGADVTFKNIELNVINGYHDQIFANGYHLTFVNVTRASGSRLIDLVAGSLYSARQQPAVTVLPGNHGQITVQGNCQFGNIYAGSINDNFYGNASITLQDVKSSFIGDIYASGANEAVFNGDNWFGDIEPPAPVPDAELYTIDGKVSITLRNSPVRTINGAGADTTEVSINTENLVSSCSYTNIDKITVEKGKFQPASLSSLPNRNLSAAVPTGGTLDLRKLTGNLALENFWGGGTLILETNALLTITGEVTGTTSFSATAKDSFYDAGIVAENRIYIETVPTSVGIFAFDPYPTQKDLKLEKQSNGDWKIVKPSSENPTVTFTYKSEDDFLKGDVDCSSEIIDSINGTPAGSKAFPYEGYHFVNWTKDGTIVSTDPHLIPQKSGNAYISGNYIAHFAEGDAPETPDPENPEPEQPENPDPETPDVPDSGNTKPGSTDPSTPAPPAAPKPSAPSVTAPQPVKVSLSKPKISLKRGKKYAVIKYKKVKNAHGYEIYRSTKKKSGYKKITDTKKTSYKNKKLKSKKKYYYKVRAYRIVNGKKYYSSYSSVKSVKVK